MSERLAAQKNDFLKDARLKFPKWNNDAASHLITLQSANAKRPCKGLDAYLLRHLAEMKDKAEAEAEGSAAADKRKEKEKSPKKGKSNDPKLADPLLETVDVGLAARSAADDAADTEKAEETEETEKEKDATEKDATEKAKDATEKDVDPPRGIRDEDLLLKPAEGEDEEALNLEAVVESEKRELRKRNETPKHDAKAKEDERPHRQKAKATRMPRVETESDDEKPLFEKPSKSKKPAKKKRKTSESPIAVVSDSEEEKDKKGRFKLKEVSRILTDFDIASIRPLSQQMMLARDGIDVNATAPARLLNMHTILQAAEQKMESRDFKSFKAALLTSYDDKNDQ